MGSSIRLGLSSANLVFWWDVFIQCISYTIEHASVGLSHITAGNQCVHCSTSYPMQRSSHAPWPVPEDGWDKLIWKKAVSRQVATKNLLGSKFYRPVSLLATIIDSSLRMSWALERTWMPWATDFGHMTSPWQQCRSMRIIWQNGMSDTPTF